MYISVLQMTCHGRVIYFLFFYFLFFPFAQAKVCWSVPMYALCPLLSFGFEQCFTFLMFALIVNDINSFASIWLHWRKLRRDCSILLSTSLHLKCSIHTDGKGMYDLTDFLCYVPFHGFTKQVHTESNIHRKIIAEWGLRNSLIPGFRSCSMCSTVEV